MLDEICMLFVLTIPYHDVQYFNQIVREWIWIISGHHPIWNFETWTGTKLFMWSS